MEEKQHEKTQVTVVSVLAALALTVVKVSVGVLTGSLGMLSEAAHSGLDLVASVITFFSVRIADRPADADHPYGHGRVENLSATLQGLLLLTTAGWIIYASVVRLFFRNVPVEASIWTFVVMGASIAIDFWRSRLLRAAARKFHSAALEADALNFHADMYSSAVVIAGLALTWAGQHLGLPSMEKADAVAALVVALMIIRMSGGLAGRAVDILLDRAPGEVAERMTRAIRTVPGVVQAVRVRLRESGNRVFADVVVTAPRTASLAEAHDLSDRVEAAVRSVEPRTETLVHVEPIRTETETAAERIRAASLRLGINTHHEQVYRVDGRLEASLHIEVDPELPLREAHLVAGRLVAAIRQDNPLLGQVDAHIEVAAPGPMPRRRMDRGTEHRVTTIIAIVQGLGVGAHCHEARLYRADGAGWGAVLHCDFDPELAMREIHRRTEQIEHALRQHFPELLHVLIQAEPDGMPGNTAR